MGLDESALVTGEHVFNCFVDGRPVKLIVDPSICILINEKRQIAFHFLK